MTRDEKYMWRCLELARLGAGKVAPNPMVGAVLVYRDKIIGEGWHREFGKPHAEVNCIESVNEKDRGLIADCTLYVSLEPCAHFGKTPPCTELIIKNKIHQVVIGCRDPFPGVNGKGIQQLRAAGITVTENILDKEARHLNARFFTWHKNHRPYVILKWAQTADGFMALSPTLPGNGVLNKRLLVSNETSNRLGHKWRSEETSILIGTNTALMDDPELTTRLWPGVSPVRLVIDMELKLSPGLKIFRHPPRTIVFNKLKHSQEQNGLSYYQVTEDVSIVRQILNALAGLKLQSVLVEGGTRLLQSFIDENAWDEARVITNNSLEIKSGLPAPSVEKKFLLNSVRTGSDTVDYYGNLQND